MKIETQLIKGKLSVTEFKSSGFFFKLFSDYRVLELYQTGLIEHLNLKDLASAFFILALGISASLLIFLVEQCRRFKKIAVKPLAPKPDI